MRLPLLKTVSSLVVALLLAGSVACGSDEPSEDSAIAATTEVPSIDTKAAEGEGTVDVDIYLVDSDAFAVGAAPYVVAVPREVDATEPIAGAIDALFEGPTDTEASDGVELVASEATGATLVALDDGVARVQLVGGCDSGGSTLTVAAQLIPTMQQFDEVETLKILDPDGGTTDAESSEDSIPVCLEP